MREQTVTVSLPESIYDRIQKTAQAGYLSSEEVIQQSIMILLPALEADVPSDSRANISKLPLLADIQLWKIANCVMENSRQTAMENFAEIQKHRSLTEIEQSELDSLINEAQQLMLSKAEARRILAQRGHTIFRRFEH